SESGRRGRRPDPTRHAIMSLSVPAEELTMRCARTALMLLSTLLTLTAASALGQQPPSGPTTTVDPDAVEEDWQLVVMYPDPVGVGPQITTAMSPDGGGPAPFVAF